MAETKVNSDEYVKKDKMYIVVVIAVILGFIGGVIYSEYISHPIVSDKRSDFATKNRFHQTDAANLQIDDIFRLEKEASMNPKNAEVWTQLGNLYFDTNKVTKAINAYERSLKLKSNNANVWTDLGVMYRRNNQFNKAISAFDKAISINPKHEISMLNKGIVLFYDLHDKRGAIEAWEGLLQINPSARDSRGQSIASMIQEIKSDLKQQ